MTTHYRAPFSNTHAVCGQRTRNWDNPFECRKCQEALRRQRAAEKKTKEVTHAPVAALPSGADVNAGNSIDNTTPNGVSAVTDADADRSTTGSVVAFGHAAGSTIGVTVRKNPHAFAYAYSHIAGSVITFSKFADPRKPAWG